MDWFTSDTHFGHRLMITKGLRPQFSSVDEMDQYLIARWNERVEQTDDVYVLGDFSFRDKPTTIEIFHQLRGRKHLIVGNHDWKRAEKWGNQGALNWVEMTPLKRWKKDGRRLILCHFPLLTWPSAHKGTHHLHGHSHGNLKVPETTRLDVGVDCVPDYAPISEADVFSILVNRKYHFLDHHVPETENGMILCELCGCAYSSHNDEASCPAIIPGWDYNTGSPKWTPTKEKR